MNNVANNQDNDHDNGEVAAVSEGVGEDFQVVGDLEAVDFANKKAGGKKTKKAKKGKKKKERVDGITRFFNDYGESPHL